jgi:hypothetical protein
LTQERELSRDQEVIDPTEVGGLHHLLIPYSPYKNTCNVGTKSGNEKETTQSILKEERERTKSLSKN